MCSIIRSRTDHHTGVLEVKQGSTIIDVRNKTNHRTEVVEVVDKYKCTDVSDISNHFILPSTRTTFQDQQHYEYIHTDDDVM